MYRVTCNQCGASVITSDGNTDALACPCCPEAHSHEANANGCPGAGLNHADGAACGLGVEDCTVCRPCTVEFAGIVRTGPVVVQAR